VTFIVPYVVLAMAYPTKKNRQQHFSVSDSTTEVIFDEFDTLPTEFVLRSRPPAGTHYLFMWQEEKNKGLLRYILVVVLIGINV